MSKISSQEIVANGSDKIMLQRLLIFIFPLLLYSWTITFDYTLDDSLMITENKFTKKGIAGLPEIFSYDAFVGFFGHDKILVAGGRYRPLTHAMFAIEYEFWGFNPRLGHFFNVLFYALLCLIILETLKICFAKYKNPNHQWWKNIPFIATLLFIAHPIHTEVVSNIKGRDEIVSLGAAMLTLMLSLKYVENKKKHLLLISFIAFLLAMFSKENAITFFGVIPLTLFFFSKAKLKDYVAVIIPVFIAIIIFLVARYNALGFFIPSTVQTEILNNPYIHSSKAEEIATTIFTWLIYLKLMLFPYPLTHDYYPWHFEILSFSNIIVWFALIIISAIIYTAVKLFREKHAISYSILFFIFTFSIQSNLIFNIGTFMNERFIFVSILGFTLIIACYLSAAKQLKGKIPAYLLIFLLSAYSIKSFTRSLAWKDNYTLFTTDVKHSPNSAKVNVSAAEALLSKAQQEKNTTLQKKMYEDAYRYALKAQKIHPAYFGAYDLAGKAAFHLDDFDVSFANYAKCVSINPNKPTPLNNILIVAEAASQKQRYDDSKKYLEWLIKFKPDSMLYKYKLALLFEQKQDFETTLKILHEITDKDPENLNSYVKLGEIYGRYLNDLNSSEKYLLKAWDVDSTNFSTNENLGIVYGLKQNFEKSLLYFQRALEIDPANKRLHSNIANTHKMLGNNTKAEEHKKLASE